MEFESADHRAQRLLDHVRGTPMRRGALSKLGRQLKLKIAAAIAAELVPGVLAERMAFQLAFKCHPSELEDPEAWTAIGRTLLQEIVRLRTRVGMADRQIIIVLPKLSAAQIEEFVEELTYADRRIARTVLDAAVDAADPLTAGRRFLADIRLVARRLQSIDPSLARTLANATFAAVAPLHKAMEHVQRLSTARRE